MPTFSEVTQNIINKINTEIAALQAGDLKNLSILQAQLASIKNLTNETPVVSNISAVFQSVLSKVNEQVLAVDSTNLQNLTILISQLQTFFAMATKEGVTYDEFADLVIANRTMTVQTGLPDTNVTYDAETNTLTVPRGSGSDGYVSQLIEGVTTIGDFFTIEGLALTHPISTIISLEFFIEGIVGHFFSPNFYNSGLFYAYHYSVYYDPSRIVAVYHNDAILNLQGKAFKCFIRYKV